MTTADITEPCKHCGGGGAVAARTATQSTVTVCHLCYPGSWPSVTIRNSSSLPSRDLRRLESIIAFSLVSGDAAFNLIFEETRLTGTGMELALTSLRLNAPAVSHDASRLMLEQLREAE